MRITAAVFREKFAAFEIDSLELTDPRPDEVLVRIVASGMCQTDQHARDGYYPMMKYPAVFGHEGAGEVIATGSAVRKVKTGDHVIISFPWCGACQNCRQHAPAYCLDARKLKSSGTRADGSTLMCVGDDPVYSAFFQQSSFATYAIANERFVVKVRRDAPLEQLGPFACSIQTGAGAVLNAMQPRPGESCVVFGAGAVGLAGLMAAKHSGCDPLIAVDVHEHRLALARELGATHTINHTNRTDVVAEIRKITGAGARYALESSALPAVLREAVEALSPVGTCILVGTARAGTEVTLEMPVVQQGRILRGVVQGDSRPDEFIPQLVDLMMDGKLPAERMMKFYDLADINRAAKDSSEGRTIKPVLRMPH